MTERGDVTREYEQRLKSAQRPHYILKLFVTGMTPRSTDAITRIKAICEEFLRGRYDLEVVDIFQQPELAREDQIVATPTLVKKQPLPLKRIVGDLSNRRRILQGLDLQEARS